MSIPIKDKSSYLKGLLIIARHDGIIQENEKAIIRKLAIELGFASDFYEETINNLLANKYILDDPIIFTNRSIAESFTRDALKIALLSSENPEKEIEWLRNNASLNNIKKDWFEELLSLANKRINVDNSISSDFALFSII